MLRELKDADLELSTVEALRHVCWPDSPGQWHTNHSPSLQAAEIRCRPCTANDEVDSDTVHAVARLGIERLRPEVGPERGSWKWRMVCFGGRDSGGWRDSGGVLVGRIRLDSEGCERIRGGKQS